jgi:hypothetical protein
MAGNTDGLKLVDLAVIDSVVCIESLILVDSAVTDSSDAAKMELGEIAHSPAKE